MSRPTVRAQRTSPSAAPDWERADPSDVLRSLADDLDRMSPEVKRAASYVMDHPGLIAVSSMRGLAATAGVAPNTMVRMARALGFPSYEEFRAPFRRLAADGGVAFPERASFLQQLERGEGNAQIVAAMADAAIGNLERAFASLDSDTVTSVADLFHLADRVYVLGTGISRPLAENFAYVARMAFQHVWSIPTLGLPVDDIARMTERDLLFAIAFAPYRRETIEAISLAPERGVPLVAVTDSHASPLVRIARHAFVVPIDSPLPFSSSTAATAVLETLLAVLFGRSPTDVTAAVAEFHERRRTAGVYLGRAGR